MATTPKAMNIIKQVLIAHKNGVSIREIARMQSMSPTTVQRYISMAKEDSLDIDTLVKLDDPALNHRFNCGNPAYCDERFEDFKKRIPYFKQELERKFMTVQLLWEEYKKDVPNGYSLTQFRYHIRQNKIAAKTSTSQKIFQNPGVKASIDFAGKKLSYVDMETGEVIEVETFVMVLPYSGYTFVKCIPSQSIDNFLSAIAAGLSFFGGAPQLLVPDNLRSAVSRPDRWAPKLTDGMMELAAHYGCNVKPARVRRPKDKPDVEDAVNKGYMRIYAPLRNRIFHSLDELNIAISELLSKYNSRRMQGCDYSRVERFISSEKPALIPLPSEPYQMKRRALLTVAPNSFIRLGHERHNYSVPCRLIGYQVEVIFTDTQVRIYYADECVATHNRAFTQGGYTWEPQHLPSQTQAYYEYSAQYFIDKAERRYGPTVAHVVRDVFSDTTKPCELFYNAAQGILSLGRSTEPETFLLACKIAIQYDKCNYTFIKNLVKSKCRGYLALQSQNVARSSAPMNHTNIRGKQAFQ